MLHPPVTVEDTVVPLLADLGGGGCGRRRRGRAVSPCGWGDASLSTPTEVAVVAAGDTDAATPKGAVLPATGDTAAATPE
jgi:hypothetical protein